MGTNCAPLLADLFLYYYDADFIQEPLGKKDKKLATSFNLTFRYIDDVLSINNLKNGDYVKVLSHRIIRPIVPNGEVEIIPS